MNRSLLKFLCFTFLCVVCIGCGDGMAVVSGYVTYQNVPVKDGQIRFLPVSNKGPSAAAFIIDGHYSTKVKPGDKKVQILAFKVVGKENIGDKIIDIKEQCLPRKFNAQTELTCKIDSNETHDFNLPL